MKTQHKRKDARQGDICNLRVFTPIFAKIMITSPPKMNKGGGWKSIQWDTEICEAI